MPWLRRYLKRLLVSSGVPKPANWRIVHSRPRYMVGCAPRVNGYWPGRPRRSGDSSWRSASVTTSGMGMPESVTNCLRRSGIFAVTAASSSRAHCALASPTAFTVAAS